MSGLIYELVEVLNEQAINFENLIHLSNEKKGVITENDIKNLQKITEVENFIIGNNQKLEKKRMAINNHIATVLSVDKEKLTLSRLLELIKNQKEYPMLIEAGNKIKRIVADLKTSNDENKLLINFSLDYIDFNMNLIRGAVFNMTTNYPLVEENNNEVASFFDTRQ